MGISDSDSGKKDSGSDRATLSDQGKSQPSVPDDANSPATHSGTGATGVAPGVTPDVPGLNDLHTAGDDAAEQQARETWDQGPSQYVEPLPDEVPIPVNREQFDADGLPHNPVDNIAGPYDVTEDEEAQRAAKLQANPNVHP